MVEARRRLLRRQRASLAALLSFLAASCATTARPRPAVAPASTGAQPEAASALGVASWYGPGFDGHRTSSGAIYDQNQLTAASSLYPLGSRVMVTNLDNGRSVVVLINDHGPFKKGRKIDLSHEAARVIGMLGPGTAKVRIDLLGAPAGSRPVGPPRYYVQVGSFSNSGNAGRLQQTLAVSYPDAHVDRVDAGTRRYYRVRMGAFMSREAAEARAADTSRLGLPVVIVTE
ncbi:MAG TPA: septal ring lytic transglycosylase RlpA family protein [Candidatus Binataceae bacterium]|nr:septal ring lytic transglycosylase RlpA family protein [Candidatus Binataceae bacterium]